MAERNQLRHLSGGKERRGLQNGPTRSPRGGDLIRSVFFFFECNRARESRRVELIDDVRGRDIVSRSPPSAPSDDNTNRAI